MKKLLFALIALCVVAPLAAQEMEPPPIVEAAHNRVAAFLQLTDEQIVAWDVIYQIHREAEQPLKEDIAAVQAEIDALFETGDLDPAALGELVIERHALGAALFDVHLIYHEDFVALLDETQARKLRFIARADDVQRIIPSFKLFELIPRR
jgi:hypothetical protein